MEIITSINWWVIWIKDNYKRFNLKLQKKKKNYKENASRGLQYQKSVKIHKQQQGD